MRVGALTKYTIPLLALMLLVVVVASAQTSSSLSGIVHDQQGNAIVGAKVVATNPARGQTVETTTSSEGTFTFTTLQPGTYTVTVEAPGFKKFVKTGIVLNVADKQSTGVIALEVGEISTTVEVIAEAAQLQIKTESGEQGNVISNTQLQNLAINGRNYLDLLKLTPGVVVNANFQVSGPGGFGAISIAGTRQNQHNLTIDGTTNVDTGSNGTQHIALSLDNIAEFKILTANYQAEYGRSAGGDIKIVTKSGTREFHGTGFYFHRHEQFNANSFFNNANGRDANGFERNPRNFFRYNQQGYNIGGPVKLPKKFLQDKLFFFWSQEWQEQLVPQAARLSRVPTAAEVAGDFSQTRDGNGVAITIRDPLTGQPFPNNRIPPDRINPNGTAILKLFNKFENTPLGGPENGFRYNHNSQLSVSYPRREESLRLDYNITENTRMFVRYTTDSDKQVMPYGLGWTGGANQIPFDNLVFKQGPAWNSTVNLTTALSPTLTNEFVFGSSQNNLTLDPTVPDAASYKGIGFTFRLPFNYPDSQWFNITFGGIPNQNFGGTTGYSQFPYKNSNTTFDIYDNISKIWGSHIVKAGIYYQRSRKDQAAGDSAAIAFSHNTNNPNNAGHPYANALLGNFDTYRQPNIGIFQGHYRSTNLEWYLQDNWKVTPRLTLDYGLRMNLIYPQFDKRQQDFYFVPEKFNASQAIRLYQRTCLPGTFPCDGSSSSAPTSAQRAVDPANPSALLPSFLIGRIVPGSGNPFNGMTGSRDGYFPGGIKSRGIQWGPAFGFAYDTFGNQKTVLRGGYRIGYDRVSGNALIFPAVGMPPLFINPIFNFGNLDTVGQSTGQIALGTVGVIGADPNGHVANVHSFSLQIQQQIGWDTVLSVGYVGSLGRHLQEVVNLNYIPYGMLFTKAAQDPSRFPNGIVPDRDDTIAQVYKDKGLAFDGSKALPADFLRRFPGYSTVGMRVFGGSSNYHSMQVTLNRKFTRSFSYGLAYTWSKVMGTANGDGDFINPECSRCYDYRRLAFDRTHLLVINYDWKLPGLKDANWLLKGVINGWQLTGITQFVSGQPEDVGVGIPGVNLSQRVGGTWTEPVRGFATGPIQTNPTRDKFFNWENIRLPDIGTKGPFPRNFVVRPGINVTDLSIFKNFPFGGEGARNIQLRVEMFNVFNHPQFSDMNRGVNFNIASNFSDYVQKQQAAAAHVQNVRGSTLSGTPRIGNGVGEVNSLHGSVAANRIIQLAVKIFF